MALLRLGETEKVWTLFKRAPDERVRSYLIHWSEPLRVDRQMIIQHLAIEDDVGKRAALPMLLGEFPDSAWLEGQQERLIEQLLAIFEKGPDPGLHATSAWLLRKWKCDEALKSAMMRLGKNEVQRCADWATDKRQWYVNRQGQTFAIVDARQPFMMGSPSGEPEREDNETQHERKIGRRYAIAASPVTKEQSARFLRERPDVAKALAENIVPTDDSPQNGMTWYEAADYCNWLSEKEGIRRDQWCYEPNEQGKFAAGMRAKDNYLALTGYRLPTEAEWEFACRAGTITRFYFGQNDTLLVNYAWYRANSKGHTWPVARLKPNDLGLFDMLGNVWVWCESPPRKYPEGGLGVADDSGSSSEVANDSRCAVRSGAYNNLPGHARAAYRGLYPPLSRETSFGFRPVQTINY